MDENKHLKRRLRFSDYPESWRALTVAVDWAGDPLVLFDEGKGSQPKRDAGMGALLEWLNTPARAHHLIYWQGGAPTRAEFANAARALVVSHIQPFGDGWLLAEGRGGNARIFNRTGSKMIRTLDFGDASEDIQTTSSGHIWVSYFDEGVFGSGIGQNGLVCFDRDGHVVFRYDDYARRQNLPPIADCYALNVCEETVWACYYTHFPLVCLKDFKLHRMWKDLGPTSAFAIRDQQLVRFPAYNTPYLLSRAIDDPDETVWKLVDPEGNNLSHVDGDSPEERPVPFSVAARGPRLFVLTEKDLFELS